MVHSKTEHGASELHSLSHSIGRGKEIMGRDNAFGERRTERKVDDGHCRRQKKKDVIIFVRSARSAILTTRIPIGFIVSKIKKSRSGLRVKWGISCENRQYGGYGC